MQIQPQLISHSIAALLSLNFDCFVLTGTAERERNETDTIMYLFIFS